jgi:hypothetical protein
MQNFRIYDDEHPASAAAPAHYSYDEGNWQYRLYGQINVLEFQDEGESVQVWVAEKRRIGIAELEDDQPFTIFNGVLA